MHNTTHLNSPLADNDIPRAAFSAAVYQYYRCCMASYFVYRSVASICDAVVAVDRMTELQCIDILRDRDLGYWIAILLTPLWLGFNEELCDSCGDMPQLGNNISMEIFSSQLSNSSYSLHCVRSPVVRGLTKSRPSWVVSTKPKKKPGPVTRKQGNSSL